MDLLVTLDPLGLKLLYLVRIGKIWETQVLSWKFTSSPPPICNMFAFSITGCIPEFYPKTNGCWRNEDVCVVSYHFYDGVYWNQPSTGITNSRTPSHPTVALCKGFTYMLSLFPGPHHFLLHHTRVSHLRPHLFDATQWPYLAPTACTLCRSVVKPGISGKKTWNEGGERMCWQNLVDNALKPWLVSRNSL